VVTELSVETTDIPGLLVVRLPLHEDSRGWFKENWQRAKMTALGLPDFGPVQHSVAYNARRGVTRGVHTEPWDKFISVAQGRIFGAWVDMREGDSFGRVFAIEADPTVAVFVPRGVGNSYQVLEDGTTYSYLVNDHWRAGLDYPALNLADPTVAIPWPIPLAEAEISDKDRTTPMLADVEPMKPKRTLVIGALGQLGRALTAAFPGADLVDLPAVVEPVGSSAAKASAQAQPLDVTDPAQVARFPWNE
jgi:dTDP-4-dehydrorhamnose 3,5-epimerase